MTTAEQLKYAYQSAYATRPTTDDLDAVRAGDMTLDDWYDRVQPDLFGDALEVCEDLEAPDISDEIYAGLSDSWRDALGDYSSAVHGFEHVDYQRELTDPFGY